MKFSFFAKITIFLSLSAILFITPGCCGSCCGGGETSGAGSSSPSYIDRCAYYGDCGTGTTGTTAPADEPCDGHDKTEVKGTFEKTQNYPGLWENSYSYSIIACSGKDVVYKVYLDAGKGNVIGSKAYMIEDGGVVKKDKEESNSYKVQSYQEFNRTCIKVDDNEVGSNGVSCFPIS